MGGGKFHLSGRKRYGHYVLRVALYSLPPRLKEMQVVLQRLTADEEAAGMAREYERAAEYKMRRLQLQDDFEHAKLEWQQENTIDEVVSAEDIAGVVAQWTGIPTSQVLETESEKLLRMEDAIHERIIGQEGAVTAIAHAIRRARSGLKDPRRPIGSFMFLGPTGVGKTELTKALAEFLFGSEEALIQLDMSEFMERHSVARLVGAPPGYVGYEDAGQLTEAIRRRPYSIVVFDEIEKAHPEAFNMLLQIMEEGTLTDARGRRVDFRNSIIVMTSNVGADQIKRQTLSFNIPKNDEADDKASFNEMRKNVTEQLRRMFRPEFLNRVDATIVFRSLTKDETKQIVDLELNKVRERLIEHAITLEMTDEARGWLAEKGYDPEYGARPLRRLIQNEIEDELSDGILSGRYHLAGIVRVTVRDDQLALENVEETDQELEAPSV